MNQQPLNQPPQGQPAIRLLRPEHIRTIQYLSASEKQRYEEGLQQLWAKIEQNPAESQEHVQAKQKVMDFSRMVINKIKNLHARNQASAQGQTSLAGGQQQPNQGAQPQPQAQAQVQIQAPAQTSATTVPKPTMPMPPHRPQALTANNNATNPNTMPTNAPTTGAPTSATVAPVPRHIMEHITKLPWAKLPIPSQLTPEQGQQWLTETKSKYARALFQMEATRNRVTKVDAVLKDRQEKGILLAPDELKRLQEQRVQDRKSHAEADSYVKNVRAQFPQISGAQAPSQPSGAHLQSSQPGRSQPMQPGNSSGVASTHSMQVPTASINAAMDAAKTTQIAAANRAGSVGGAQQSSQPQPQQPQPQQLSANPPQTQRPATPATPSTSAPGQQTSHSAPAPTQIKIEPGVSTQHPPPVNTALAAASSAHMPSAGTPTQVSARVQTPQSAQQATGANVRPLTHAAAVNRANSSSNITGQPSNSSSGVANNTPGSAGMTVQPQHTHAHPQPTPTLTSKMPIPKTLHEKATAPPQPVTVGGGVTPGRPSYGGGNGAGGVMNQPVVAKMPIPQFDAEGDHVLSKKKLDELVRQVCGGGSPGADGNYLTPDVEESVLSVADNFVDNVLHMACRLAKERGSKVLEIRDIQLVLERVYNIRIPGYTSDELRTVRKVQPSPNWIAKMSAIQAAKVTSGKDDK
ncbi:hypothetical protein HD806DRAFT_490325 [Xylariaceae sp. AK1471]|nr:hypothetical protein HD806DRAFT_490325 [Xylariaceae sp. AK1471]